MEKKITDENLTSMSEYIRKTWDLPDTDIKSYSGLTLAYIGDAIYDLIIRTYVVESGNAPVNKLHKQVVKMVQASLRQGFITILSICLLKRSLPYIKEAETPNPLPRLKMQT